MASALAVPDGFERARGALNFLVIARAMPANMTRLRRGTPGAPTPTDRFDF